MLGGGPAGCAAAILLHRLGHQVLLVTKPEATASPLGESVPPSTRKLFDVLGVGEAVNRAGFVRATGNTVWWGSRDPRVEYFADQGLGWQVTTDRLQGLLRRCALDAGVTMQSVRAETDLLTQTDAVFTLDCTGRAGVIARSRGLREHESHHRTVAVVGLWRAQRPFTLPDATHTLIESYDNGWTWSVPRTLDERFVAVMVDPRRSQLRRGSSSRDVYLQELRKTRHLSVLVADATLVDGPTGWDASMYSATKYVDDDVLLVGDAGSFIDPLSSAGVKKALASGWLAAVAVHTSLRRPTMRSTALKFFADREAEVYTSFKAMTRQYLADAADAHAYPFWRDRGDESGASDDREEIAAAYEDLRQKPELRVRRNEAVRVAVRPAISGTEIVMESRLVREDRSHGVRYAFDVDLVALVDLAPQHRSVPHLFEAYNARHAPVALPDFLGALSTALAHRWLLWV